MVSHAIQLLQGFQDAHRLQPRRLSPPDPALTGLRYDHLMLRTDEMRPLGVLGLLGLLGLVNPAFSAFGAFGAFSVWGSENRVLRFISYLGFLGLFGFLGFSEALGVGL